VEASFTQRTARAARAPISGLGKLTAGALAGVAALLAYAQATIVGGFDPIVSAIAIVPLLAAGAIFAGWRWAPLLGTLIFGLLLFLLLGAGGGEVGYTLGHPGSVLFGFIVVAVPLLLVGLAASISAVVQNYRAAERRTPRWLPGALLLVAGLAFGAAVVGSMPQAGDSAGISPETLAQLPAVTIDMYEGGEIRVKAGETVALRLENPDPVAHDFTVDELGVSAPMPAGKNSLALFQPTQPGTYTFYCTPHYAKASGQGMHGTLIVE
jgi:plastocyanin